MTRMDRKYNWGQELSKDNPNLYRQLNDVYTDIAERTNGKSNKNQAQADPVANSPVNKNFDIGDIWVRTDTNSAWIMTSRTTAENVTWTPIT